MIIELRIGDRKAIVDTKGGYLTNYTDERGDIIYPKRIITTDSGEQKTRGGCHVCLPNFGPGGESGLEQHGYGRTSQWQIANQSETFVELVLGGEGAYANMESTLRYEVGESSCTMQLTLKNDGTSPVHVSPGFHPYFYRGGQSPTLAGVTHQDLAEFADTKFIEGDSQQLVIAGRQLGLQSSGLLRYAVWTDQLGDYLCVEPTQSGNAFVEDLSRADVLAAGGTQVYSFTITW